MVRFVLLLWIAFSLPQISVASELRCNGSLIRTGMKSAAVENLCGKPVVTHLEQRSYRETRTDKSEKDVFESIETWLIDQKGSNLRVVEFVDNRVTSVRFLDYRSDDEATRASNCNSSKLREIVLPIMVKYYCGSPLSTTMISEEFEERPSLWHGGILRKRRVRTESWDYQVTDKEMRVTIRGDAVSDVRSM